MFVSVLTNSNITSFTSCPSPGGRCWLWRGVQPESLTLANGSPPAGVVLGSDWLKTPRRPIMTLYNLITPSVSLPPYLQRGNQHAKLLLTNARREALVTNITNLWDPHSASFFFRLFHFQGFLKVMSPGSRVKVMKDLKTVEQHQFEQ